MTLPADRRIAVVTGASSGIGAATARHLAQAGYHVVTSEDSVAALADMVAELSPRGLDVLVNNAGGAFGATPVAQATATSGGGCTTSTSSGSCRSPARCSPS